MSICCTGQHGRGEVCWVCRKSIDELWSGRADCSSEVAAIVAFLTLVIIIITIQTCWSLSIATTAIVGVTVALAGDKSIGARQQLLQLPLGMSSYAGRRLFCSFCAQPRRYGRRGCGLLLLPLGLCFITAQHPLGRPRCRGLRHCGVSMLMARVFFHYYIVINLLLGVSRESWHFSRSKGSSV